jgi:hypothetical protein
MCVLGMPSGPRRTSGAARLARTWKNMTTGRSATWLLLQCEGTSSHACRRVPSDASSHTSWAAVCVRVCVCARVCVWWRRLGGGGGRVVGGGVSHTDDIDGPKAATDAPHSAAASHGTARAHDDVHEGWHAHATTQHTSAAKP